MKYAAPRLILLLSHLLSSLDWVSEVHALVSEGSCDLEPWLSDERAPGGGEDGFHVLCVRSPSEIVVYPGGVASASPLRIESGEGSAITGLRRQLKDHLKISSVIRYSGKGFDVQWKKQPWTIFTDEGIELQPGTEDSIIAKSSGGSFVWLLFEGGAWRWPTKEIGYERQIMSGVTLRTVSRQPALFEVSIDSERLDASAENHLSPDLLAHVIKFAEKRLGPSITEGKVDKAVRSSEQTFIDYGSDSKLEVLRAATANLLRGQEENLEALQVLRYSKGQHYDAHRDYWDPREFPDVPRFRNQEGFWHQRHATLLWYLDGPKKGGETWFPRAHGGPIPYGEWMACDQRGAKVFPANATAVLFYSLRADGDIDEYSWHCGCPVKAGVKWAANSWYLNSPRGRRPHHRRLVSSEL